MHKRFQILLFYIIIVIVFGVFGWMVTKKDENKMQNCLLLSSLAMIISALLWQNYGQYMNQH